MVTTAPQPAGNGTKGTGRVATWTPEIRWETRENGATYVWREDELGPYPDRITERLEHWAKATPDQTWIAARDKDGNWRKVSYSQALATVRSIAQGLMNLGLGPDHPVLILSGNSIEHALIALAAQHVGIPSAAVAPAYALISEDYAKLKDIAAQITPGAVFADKAEGYDRAVSTVFDASVAAIAAEGNFSGRPTISFADLAATPATDAVDTAAAKVGPDTVAKFLFTSGTTGSPKAVIQTQRMMCANQAMVADCYAFLTQEPPVIVDWAPWNHVASGNKVFNMALYHGGTFYIDEGKPTPKGIAETLKNLKEISPTWYFNVPSGYEMLIHAMESDDQLRQNFFKNLKMMMYAGAGMAQHTWDDLIALSARTAGYPINLVTGLGATETAPFSLAITETQPSPGNVGIPARGITLKLVPNGGKLEARLKGPNVTPGYWRNAELTANAFDDEGFYCLGDALRYAVPGDPSKGFYFDGRIAENFKLQTGTWVAVGALRATLVNDLGGLIRDCVITGENHEELGALVLPALPAMRAFLGADAPEDNAEVLAHPKLRQELSARLGAHGRKATGSATRITRLIFLDSEPSFDRGEITEKGSLNQRAILAHRAELVDRLYNDGPDVILPKAKEPA
ncbi:feruloyl-CoA synthase [Roseibium litorale]|uniref:Feruloyl-CoA synthase n=1 Tax=Roseibium litorale TaxID=2803841 RepID=A0ABR9CIZ6_9HYPH|nr:feruloyl-CoA synthase [Roseibium litorale]MBD8890792.1 feruloyl-CoA synthase [Roseibium litorale]